MLRHGSTWYATTDNPKIELFISFFSLYTAEINF